MAGTVGKRETMVTNRNTAEEMGSGSLQVFGTPAMVALIEAASCEALRDVLKPEETSVGTLVNVTHLAPTPVGMKVSAEATIKSIDGRKVSFEVVASDEKGKIGEGTHERVIVHSAKFFSKAQSKI